MKFLVLLSLVAFCSSLPTSFDKHISVDIHRENQYGDDGEQLVHSTQKQWQQPNFGVQKFWNQQRFIEEPRNLWVDSEYVRNFNELDNLTPTQRIQLLLKHIQLRSQKNQWNNDVSEEEYLRNMLSQYLPEHLQESKLTNEQMVPQLMQYFEQNPLKYQHVMQEGMPTQWTVQQILKHLAQHKGEGPWTREQIRQHIVKYQQYLGNNPLNYQQLEQLVELAYRLQFELNQWNTEQVEQTKINPWARFSYNLNQRNILNGQKYQQYPWVNQNWEQIETKPWARFLYNQGRFFSEQERTNPWAQTWNQRYEQQEDEYPQQWLSEQKEPQMWKSLNRYQQKNQKWNQEDDLNQLVERMSQWDQNRNQNWNQQGELNQVVEQGQYLPQEQNWKHSWNPTWTQRWN